MKNSPPPPCPECNRLRDGNLGTFCDIHEVAFTAPLGVTAHTVNLNGEAPIDARASIVAFLTAEAKRLAEASRAARGDFVEDVRALDRYCDGLAAQAENLDTLAAQIARGDDLRGGE